MKKLVSKITGVFLLFSLLPLSPCFSDIRLPKCFSDSMVVQRHEEFPVWGEALPEEDLTVWIQQDGQEKIQLKTKADSEGLWSVKFPPLKVGKPYNLSVEGKDSSVVIRDIVAGDVWLCSGQSNMEWTIRQLPNHEKLLKKIKLNQNLRILKINRTSSPKQLKHLTSVRHWQPADAKSVVNMSAVAYYFGEKLQKDVQIPIGLVVSSWGGSACEAWVSEAGFEGKKSLEPLVKFDKGLTKGAPNRRVSRLFNGMIAPISRLKFKGVIWYQGESNVGRGRQYAELFPALIADWRKQFSQEKLPFLFVQLAPFRYQSRSPEALAEVWDAQLKTFKNVPYTGMVVTTDVGNPKDIHPRKKKIVGQRLADFANALAYKKDNFFDNQAELKVGPSAKEKGEQEKGSGDLPPYCGPIYKSFQVVGDKIEIEFFADKLVSSDQKPLTEFLIAGKDKKFVPAVAMISGNKVVVSSKEVAAPIAVRFCWRDTPSPNLVGGTGLPASPFRTDDFPLLSKDRDY